MRETRSRLQLLKLPDTLMDPQAAANLGLTVLVGELVLALAIPRLVLNDPLACLVIVGTAAVTAVLERWAWWERKG